MPKPYLRWDKVPVILRAKEIAVLLDENEASVRRKMQAGGIPGAKKIGGLWAIDRDEFRRFFDGETAQLTLNEEDARLIAKHVVALLQQEEREVTV